MEDIMKIKSIFVRKAIGKLIHKMLKDKMDCDCDIDIYSVEVTHKNGEKMKFHLNAEIAAEESEVAKILASL